MGLYVGTFRAGPAPIVREPVSTSFTGPSRKPAKCCLKMDSLSHDRAHEEGSVWTRS